MRNAITLSDESPSVVFLKNRDKRLARVIDMVGTITYTPYEDGYTFLIHEVIEQMLSIKAASKIYARLVESCNGVINPDSIASLTDDQLKGIGTSNAKVEYIKSITNAIQNGDLDLDILSSLHDEAVTKKLMSIRGIGTWTAKMYLIFVLDRKDILPFEDGAFLQSYRWLYKTTDISKESIIKKCSKWKPYSSIAARYMYKALDLGYTKNEFHLYKT